MTSATRATDYRPNRDAFKGNCARRKVSQTSGHRQGAEVAEPLNNRHKLNQEPVIICEHLLQKNWQNIVAVLADGPLRGEISPSIL